MIRLTRDLLLGAALMATGYALTRIGRWMQGKPRQQGGEYPVPITTAEQWRQRDARKVAEREHVLREREEWLGLAVKHDSGRWN